jgi:hypothetical protein
MTGFQTHYEEFKVHGKDLVDKIMALIHEGNIRRIILKDQKGVTFLEIPLTIAAVGVLAAPVLAALGTLAALVADFTIVVEKIQADTATGDKEEINSSNIKEPKTPENISQ